MGKNVPLRRRVPPPGLRFALRLAQELVPGVAGGIRLFYVHPPYFSSILAGFGFITGSCETISLKVQVLVHMHVISFPRLTA